MHFLSSVTDPVSTWTVTQISRPWSQGGKHCWAVGFYPEQILESCSYEILLILQSARFQFLLRKAVECIPSEWRRWTFCVILLYSNRKKISMYPILNYSLARSRLQVTHQIVDFSSLKFHLQVLEVFFFLFKTDQGMQAVTFVKLRESFFPFLRPDIWNWKGTRAWID